MKKRYKCRDFHAGSILVKIMVFALMWVNFNAEWLRTLLIIWIILEIAFFVWMLTLDERGDA